MPIIEVNHLTKEYQLGHMTSMKETALNSLRRMTFQDVKERERFKALDDINFHINEGEVVGIIGRLGDPINQAIYPEYAKLLGHEKTSETIAVTKKIMLLLLTLAFVTLAGFLIASEFIISMFFGPEYLTLMAAFYILVILNCIKYIAFCTDIEHFLCN